MIVLNLMYLNLKSNMDRFIELVQFLILVIFRDLKSNMDRFIGVVSAIACMTAVIFKIQYG